MSNTNESESPCACWPSRMCDRSAECAKVHREDRMVVLERNDEGRATVWCDPEIADIVGALNAGGLRTVASCSGHGVVAGCISLADGRELLIARNAGERDHMLSVFPSDINGMPRGSRHCEEPAASLVEQKDRRIAELEDLRDKWRVAALALADMSDSASSRIAALENALRRFLSAWETDTDGHGAAEQARAAVQSAEIVR